MGRRNFSDESLKANGQGGGRPSDTYPFEQVRIPARLSLG